VLFRVMDIVKPWPIRDLDHRIHGGLGIMLDDLVAALYAVLLLAFGGWLMT
jgi:phosphatidylglycerophosphatase A